MANIEVKPLPDSDIRNWIVESSGLEVSRHDKKSAAKKKAKREARDGDRLIIYKANNTVQSNKVVGDKEPMDEGNYVTDSMDLFR